MLMLKQQCLSGHGGPLLRSPPEVPSGVRLPLPWMIQAPQRGHPDGETAPQEHPSCFSQDWSLPVTKGVGFLHSQPLAQDRLLVNICGKRVLLSMVPACLWECGHGSTGLPLMLCSLTLASKPERGCWQETRTLIVWMLFSTWQAWAPVCTSQLITTCVYCAFTLRLALNPIGVSYCPPFTDGETEAQAGTYSDLLKFTC